MRAIVLGFLASAVWGCAPLLYLPPGGTMAQLQRGGDLNARAGVGFHGWSLGGAYALTEHVSVRASGSTDFSTSTTDARRYAQVGVGGYWAPAVLKQEMKRDGEEGFPTGLRVGIAADLGLGAAADSGSYSIANTRHDFLGAVTYVRGALEGEVSFESEYVGVGLMLRTAYISATPTAQNRDATESQYLLLEPLVGLRAGPKQFKVDLQAGFMAPIAGQGDLGLWWPLIIQMGFSFDFDLGLKPVRFVPPPEPEVVPPPAPTLPPEGPPPTPAPEPGTAPVDVPPAGDAPPPTPVPEPAPETPPQL